MNTSFGHQLRARREQMNLTLQDVAKRTRISVNILRSLELGNWAHLGGVTYARSFLRNYSRCLGLDAADAIAVLQQAAPTQRGMSVHGGEIPYDVWRQKAPAPQSSHATSPLAAAVLLVLFTWGSSPMWMPQGVEQWAQTQAPQSAPVRKNAPPPPHTQQPLYGLTFHQVISKRPAQTHGASGAVD